MLAKALQQAGAHDEALKIAEAGLSLEGEKSDDWHRRVSALAHWLRDYARGLGRAGLAVETASIAFDCTLSMRDYEAARNWSGECWAALRTKLLERLAQAPHASDRVRIYLSEAMKLSIRPLTHKLGYVFRLEFLNSLGRGALLDCSTG